MARSKKVREALELCKQYKRAQKQADKLWNKWTACTKALSEPERQEYDRVQAGETEEDVD